MQKCTLTNDFRKQKLVKINGNAKNYARMKMDMKKK